MKIIKTDRQLTNNILIHAREESQKTHRGKKKRNCLFSSLYFSSVLKSLYTHVRHPDNLFSNSNFQLEHLNAFVVAGANNSVQSDGL
jgi:hypothetical protein